MTIKNGFLKYRNTKKNYYFEKKIQVLIRMCVPTKRIKHFRCFYKYNEILRLYPMKIDQTMIKKNVLKHINYIFKYYTKRYTF